MKKAEMLPSTYITGIIIFTLIIVCGVWMINSMRQVDDSFIDDEKYSTFNQTFNKYSEVQQETDDLKETITDADTDFGAFGVLNSLISTSWNSLKLLFTSFSFMNAVFSGLYTFFGIPAFVGNLIISLIIIVLVFAIFSAILQGKL